MGGRRREEEARGAWWDLKEGEDKCGGECGGEGAPDEERREVRRRLLQREQHAPHRRSKRRRHPRPGPHADEVAPVPAPRAPPSAARAVARGAWRPARRTNRDTASMLRAASPVVVEFAEDCRREFKAQVFDLVPASDARRYPRSNVYHRTLRPRCESARYGAYGPDDLHQNGTQVEKPLHMYSV